MRRWLRRGAIGLVLLVAGFWALVWAITYHPGAIEAAPVTCAPGAPMLARGQQITVMTWNVQYMAGREYVFWYDLPDNDGPDERPGPQAIAATLPEAARIINEVRPDVLLLQEVDIGADRTGGMDQSAALQALLSPAYPCATAAFYWKAAYVPHPRVRGAVGLALVTLSRYAISGAERIQLARLPEDPLTSQFSLRRAVLAARLPIAGGGALAAFNTHLEAFAAGTTTMQDQVGEIDRIMAAESAAGNPWVLGGDLNLLPDAAAYARLSPYEQRVYNPVTEISPLQARYELTPSLADAAGPDGARWLTHSPNRPGPDRLDRVLDYLIAPRGQAPLRASVRQHDTQHISDHVPVIATYRLP